MPLLGDIALRYFVDDLPGATVRGARLQGVLQTIDDGRTLSTYSMAFLEKQGLLSLGALARGVISLEEFRGAAAAEQGARVAEAAKNAMVASLALEKQAAESASAVQAYFAKMESDPVLKKRRDARQLRELFGIGYIDSTAYARVMALLKRMAGGGRLSPYEVIWLSTDTDCWTPQVKTAYHRLEAVALTEKWQRTADPWAAINACSHWRKAEMPERAIDHYDAT